MFVTTADPILEPPIITVNTVLSLLAVDYPADKLACYVSDDGCSPITFYSLVEASKFAQLWDEYEKLCQKMEEAHKLVPSDLSADYEAFKDIKSKNHPSIIKVIWENKKGFADGIPHLIYISREKRPNIVHHYKAGAMNVLTRISGLMTNAPYTLNVDCDMYANNPKTVLHAMCLMLGLNQNENNCAFVQFPQMFYDELKDDPFGNKMVAAFEILGRGMGGIQGPAYAGTGCFHTRQVIYGLSPSNTDINEKLSNEVLEQQFGYSKEFIRSVTETLCGLKEKKTFCQGSVLSSIEAAYKVSGCRYEHNTGWGNKVGWFYGSATEDVLTGMRIQARGWKSALCVPDQPAFLGCSASGGPEFMIQRKRWATGVSEILFSKHSPIFVALTSKLQFRQSLAYTWILMWALRCIPELCYAIMSAYCLIANTSFLPRINEAAAMVPIALFLIQNLETLISCLRAGLSIRAWWNNMRMSKINAASSQLFGVLGVILKLLRLSETIFEVTQKDQFTSNDGGDSTKADAGVFTFSGSPIFVPPTTLLLLQLRALVIAFLGLQPPAHGDHGAGLLEIMCSMWAVLCFWPFLKGLFGKAKQGIPFLTICKAAGLALIFLNLSKRASMV
ncbi:Cellulose synthase [Quillaja saponaria]|uniref:Cellulose synthase n=1 Tax=Quillaja saponaria TaxID=32244 RepID=A0AAD7PAI0_QUISA|nr:Cellulose synthase [Quillaja saponaria]